MNVPWELLEGRRFQCAVCKRMAPVAYVAELALIGVFRPLTIQTFLCSTSCAASLAFRVPPEIDPTRRARSFDRAALRKPSAQ